MAIEKILRLCYLMDRKGERAVEEKIPYHLVRSDRKTMAIQIKNGQVVVRAPHRALIRHIEEFLESKRAWIEKGIARQNAVPQYPPFTAEEVRTMADAALVDIPKRVAYFAPIVGVTYGRITIRNQRTKWGSCSSKGNLNFNCVLMLSPEWVRDYIVVHELCHRKEMNHSVAFWAEVARVCPNYKEAEAWLKANGSATIERF